MTAGPDPRRAGTSGSHDRPGRERGSAIVGFTLVGGLLTLLFVALLQLTLALYTRNILIDCAGEGARFGAIADQDTQDGARRTQQLIRAALPDRYARRVSAQLLRNNGFQQVEVRVRAPLPVLAMFGAGRTLQVTGHAVVEGPSRAA